MIPERRLRYYVEDYEIYSFYFGEFEVGRKYNSPLRHDPKPSFRIKFSESGNLYWKDFGLHTQAGWDAVAFVCELHGLNRQEAVQLIWNEMVMDRNVQLTSTRPKQKARIPYKFTYRAISDAEMEFWNRRYIPRDLLNLFNIKALERLTRLDQVVYESRVGDPAYIYLFDDPESFKSYRPYSTFKFAGQKNGHVIEGWDQLPSTADHLFIQSSMKDTVVCRRIGYLGCAPTSENSHAPLLSKAVEINARFGKTYILFDNDPPGIRAAYKLSAQTGWQPVFLPKHKAKDPDDLLNLYGNYFELSNFFSKFDVSRYYW